MSYELRDPLFKLLRLRTVDALLITDLKNIRYFTGFTGSSAICLYTKKGGFFITDFRYKEQAEKEIGGRNWEIIIHKNKTQALKKVINKLRIKKIAFEPSISYEFFENLKRLGLNTFSLKKALLRLREIKSPDEVAKIKEATRRAEEAFLKVKELIRPGISEIDIAVELEYQLKKLGSRHLPFEVIVASGENSAMPHAKATTRKIMPGDLVLIDWGGEAEGYFSDMTRTFLVKTSNHSYPEKKRIYHIVKDAQEEALRAIAPGVFTNIIDQKARHYIQKKGYGKSFGHSTGHGVGLDIHELPVISLTE
jgi:Xaa-Pro aminopeptidase